MNILVTGGAATLAPLLPRAVGARLLELRIPRYRVLWRGAPACHAPGGGDCAVYIRRSANPAALEELLRDIDVVIHLAAISNDPSAELNPASDRGG